MEHGPSNRDEEEELLQPKNKSWQASKVKWSSVMPPDHDSSRLEVVYDPLTDRFFLSDAPRAPENAPHVEGKPAWNELILPPRSVSKLAQRVKDAAEEKAAAARVHSAPLAGQSGGDKNGVEPSEGKAASRSGESVQISSQPNSTAAPGAVPGEIVVVDSAPQRTGEMCKDGGDADGEPVNNAVAEAIPSIQAEATTDASLPESPPEGDIPTAAETSKIKSEDPTQSVSSTATAKTNVPEPTHDAIERAETPSSAITPTQATQQEQVENADPVSPSASEVASERPENHATPAPETISDETSNKDPTVGHEEALRLLWTKLGALVTILVVVCRFIRKRKLNRAGSAPAAAAIATVEGPALMSEVDGGGVLPEKNVVSTEVQVPVLDLHPMAADCLMTAPVTTTPKSPKKRRVRSYQAHFAQANAAASASAIVHPQVPTTGPCITWNGEAIRVHVATTAVESQCATSRGMQPPESNVASDSLCNVFDLDELARIRPAPDGFRRVNVGCVFTPLSSSSSSSEEEEPLVPQLSSSSDDDSWIAPPVFVKGDRVLFKARQRRFRGKVRRRIRRSCFYDIKADNGSVFLAVAASNIKLLEDEAPAPLRRLAKHDRVLWIPAPASSPTALTTELSYKAKIVHCRPENRYDIGLRTGRVLTKIPREELFDRPA